MLGVGRAKVGGEVGRVFLRMGSEEATAAGADPPSLEVVEREDLPLAYLPGDARRVRMRVVGDAT